jgi:hypothetical protein
VQQARSEESSSVMRFAKGSSPIEFSKERDDPDFRTGSRLDHVGTATTSLRTRDSHVCGSAVIAIPEGGSLAAA